MIITCQSKKCNLNRQESGSKLHQERSGLKLYGLYLRSQRLHLIFRKLID